MTIEIHRPELEALIRERMKRERTSDRGGPPHAGARIFAASSRESCRAIA
jgi:hypothetical protein